MSATVWQDYNFDDDIVRIVRMLQRNFERVYPWMVIPHLRLMRVEGSLRRDMKRLAECGRLIRVGGWHARQGYKVPQYPLVVQPVSFKKWGERIA